MTAPSFDQPNTWYQMLGAMISRTQNSDERVGQACFNALYIAWPEVAELVRGTVNDPFYADEGDPRIQKFLEFVKPYFI